MKTGGHLQQYQYRQIRAVQSGSESLSAGGKRPSNGQSQNHLGHRQQGIYLGGPRQGINLAAEFMADNPFRSQFNTVQDSIRKRQDVEMFLIEQFMHDVALFKGLDGRGPAAVDRMIANGVERDYSVHQVETIKLVIPVQHTIKIEPVANP